MLISKWGAVELRLDPFAIDYDCSATFVSSPLMMTGGQSATRTVRELDRLSSAPSRTEKGSRCAEYHSIGSARNWQWHMFLSHKGLQMKKPTLHSVGCLKMTQY